MAIHKFHLPDLGEKIKEAKVMKWFVKEGDIVEEYDDLAEVTTDKLNTIIPSTLSGKIHRLLIDEDQFCQTGEVLLEIDDMGEGSVASEESGTHAQPDQQSVSESKAPISEGNRPEERTKERAEVVTGPLLKGYSKTTLSNKLEKLLKASKVSGQPQKPLATPAVRSLAKSLGIDLAKVPTSDSEGRVQKQDVLAYQHSLQASQSVQDEIQVKRAHVGEQREPAPQVARAEPQTTKPVRVPGEAFETVQMSQYEQGMFKTMTSSLSVPDFLYHEEFDVTELTLLRDEINKFAETKMSFFTLLVKTFSLALETNQRVNSLYHPDSDPYSFQIHSDHNISIAIASANGLAAPNIKAVQNLSMNQIQAEINRLKTLADQSRLGANELLGGTICLSNIGSIGGTYSGPISLPNQTCIVGIGKSTSQLKFKGSSADKKRILRKEIEWTPDNFELREVLYVSFAADHRVLDGATIASFANEWKRIIEQPTELITRLR